MWSAPAERICTVLRLGSVPIFRIISGFTPEGRTTYSTSSAVGGNSSPPFHTSASMPAGRPPNASGESGSHTRVNIASVNAFNDRLLPLAEMFRYAAFRYAALRQAELGAALVRDEVGVVRVLLDPGADVGA